MTIDLTDDEALVLFDLLADFGTEADERQLRVRHAAERNALWALHARLEKALVAPLEADYAKRVEVARRRLEDQGGPW